MDESLSISFADAELATATVWTRELEAAVREQVPESEPHIERDDSLSQDFGATLVLVLGTSAVTALASGIANWLSRRSDAKLMLRKLRSDGTTTEIQVSGQLGARAEATIRDFLSD